MKILFLLFLLLFSLNSNALGVVPPHDGDRRNYQSMMFNENNIPDGVLICSAVNKSPIMENCYDAALFPKKVLTIKEFFDKFKPNKNSKIIGVTFDYYREYWYIFFKNV